MDGTIDALGVVVIAYAIGSLPAAYVIARWASGKDVRDIGEGNVGARNVFHEVGTWWGLATFAADFSKGAAVAAIFSESSDSHLLLAGVFVLVGHAFPVWLRFIGGKGLSTVGGFSVVLVPWAALAGTAVAAFVWSVRRRFLPTLVVAIVGTIVSAPLVGYGASRVGWVVGLFVLTGIKRAIDEPRMKRIEARTGWDRLQGGTAH